MKRLIRSSQHFQGTSWEKNADVWEEACEQWYNSITSSDQIEDMTYGMLVDYVADMAQVNWDVAAYFVEMFMNEEVEPLPLLPDQ